MPLQVEWVSKLRNVSSRIRSLYIVHTSMLFMALGSSIIYTGVWPYSQVVRYWLGLALSVLHKYVSLSRFICALRY